MCRNANEKKKQKKNRESDPNEGESLLGRLAVQEDDDGQDDDGQDAVHILQHVSLSLHITL